MQREKNSARQKEGRRWKNEAKNKMTLRLQANTERG